MKRAEAERSFLRECARLHTHIAKLFFRLMLRDFFPRSPHSVLAWERLKPDGFSVYGPPRAWNVTKRKKFLEPQEAQKGEKREEKISRKNRSESDHGKAQNETQPSAIKASSHLN